MRAAERAAEVQEPRVAAEAPARARAPAWFARRHAAVALALYLGGAAIMQRHALANLGTVISGNLIGDPTQYMWAMWWWPHAILDGLNPFVTHAIWTPDAYNLGAVTSTPLPSLLFWPLNELLGWVQGPVVSYNLANLVAPVLSAWFAYRLCLHLSRSPAAAIVGGWLYGFSAYGLSQLQGHLQLVFTFLPVVLVLLSVQRIDRTISGRRYIALAALALAAQLLIGTEIVFTTTCMAAVTLLAAIALAPRVMRPVLLRLVAELLAAYALAGGVCSPFLYYALSGPEVQADVNSMFRVADLLSFAIPTPLVALGAKQFLSVSSAFPVDAGFIETGTYLGLPVLVGALALAIERWRGWATKLLVMATGIAVLWALGPTLTIDGHSTIPLPWKLLDTRPLFNEVVPVRIGMYVALGMAIAFALWLARPRFSPARWLVALLAIAFLFPNVDGSYPTGQPIYSESMQSPPFIADGLYRRYLRPGEVILPIPFGPLGDSLLWQAQAQGYFRLASGWFGVYPHDYSTSVLAEELSDFRPFSDPVSQTRSFLAAHRVGAVVILRGQGGAWPRVLAQLGLRRVALGGVWLYRVAPRRL